VRGLIGAGVIGVIVLSVAAVLALGPRRFEGILPLAAVEALESLSGRLPFSAGAVRSGDTPADFLDDTRMGLVAAGPIAAMAGNVPVFRSEVISSYPTRIEGDVPAEITTIRSIMGCLVTPPMPGSVVGYVTSGESDLPMALSTYSDLDLAAGVQDFANLYRSGQTTEPVRPDDLAYEAYDVAVTETSAPVYLVLEAGSGKRIWNIHLAPEARIERVVLLGGDQAGVANVDPVVPVEALLNDGLQECGLRPEHPLTSRQSELAFASLTASEASRQRVEKDAAVEAYARWLRDSFGIDAATMRAGFDRGSLSVVGPVPTGSETMAVYAPISGSRILTSRDSFFEIAGQVPAGEDFAARVKAIATTFAFGNLANLRQGADF
jgi:hypothetical protein